VSELEDMSESREEKSTEEEGLMIISVTSKLHLSSDRMNEEKTIPLPIASTVSRAEESN
jgi:hypothetical protein